MVVRNTWRATDSGSGLKIEFAGIVIRRIAAGKLAERWAYLQGSPPGTLSHLWSAFPPASSATE